MPQRNHLLELALVNELILGDLGFWVLLVDVVLRDRVRVSEAVEDEVVLGN